MGSIAGSQTRLRDTIWVAERGVGKAMSIPTPRRFYSIYRGQYLQHGSVM